MKNILVIGGAGYIGSHTVRQLIRQGYAPVVYDDLSKGHRQAVGSIPFEQGDLGDKTRLKEVLAQHNIDAVLHFAALSEVAESVKYPERYFLNNTEKTHRLLEALVETGIYKIVFSSSAAVFGEPISPQISELHPKNPINPYGKSKLLAEEILTDFDMKYNLKSISLRYFNAAGADDAGDLGESHSPETHLIPLILQTAAGKRPRVQIFGSDYPTPDGTCVRDFVHVNDLARAHILALEKLASESKSDQFNLGSENGYSVAEIIQTAKRITGRDFNVIYSPRRPGDPAVLVADTTKVQRELGWKPHYSLWQILQTAWNWEQHRTY